MYFIILGVCFLFVGSFFIYSYFLQEEYQELALASVAEKVKADVANIEKKIAEMQHTAKSIASFASHAYQSKASQKDLDALGRSYLAHISKTTLNYNNIGIWFEPYTFDSKQKAFAIVAFKDPQTQDMNCSIYQDENSYNYHIKNWYTQFLPDDIKSTDRTCFNTGIVMSSQDDATFIGAPVYDDNDNIIGISTINTTTADFLSAITSTGHQGTARFILADKVQNKALYFDTKENSYLQGPLSSLEENSIFDNNTLSEQNIAITKKVIEQQTYFVFTAMTANNMLYAYLVPENELLLPVQNKALVTFILFGLLTAAAIFVTTHFVHNKISKPIAKITTATAQAGDNFISEMAVDADSCEEISSLLLNFNELIRKNNAALKNFMNNLPGMLYIIDTSDFTIKFKNQQMQQKFPEVLEGEYCYKSLFDKNKQCCFCPVLAEQTDQQQQVDTFNKKNNCFLRIKSAFIEWDGKKQHAIIALDDITKDCKEKKRLKVFAETDDLTGTLNKNGGFIALERLAEESAGEFITIAVIDINDLKKINETYGHLEGDFYINATVQAIRQNIRSKDILSRVGANEFMMVFHNCHEKSLLGLFMRINSDLKTILVDKSKPYKASIAFGTYSFKADKSADIIHNFNKAQQKMYENKKSFYKDHTKHD